MKVGGNKLVRVKVGGIIGHVERGSRVKQPRGLRDIYRGRGNRLVRGVRGMTEHGGRGGGDLTPGERLDKLQLLGN